MTQPPADVKVPCDARRRVALRSADRRRLGGSGGWRRKCLEELPPTLNCQWRVRGGNDRPQQYLVRLKNQPTCPLLQLRYGPSGSKAVPSHEQATRSSSTVVVAGAVVDTSPRRPLSRCAHSSHKTLIDDWAGELVCLTWTDPSGRHASFLRGAQVATGLARCGIRLDP